MRFCDSIFLHGLEEVLAPLRDGRHPHRMRTENPNPGFA